MNNGAGGVSLRELFRVVIAGVLLHASLLVIGIMVVIYYACTLFDQWRANLARKRVINAIDDETEGWETDPDDPEWQRIGALLLENPPTRSEKLWNRRLKLRFPEAIVVNTMTDVLREMEMSRFFPVSEPDIFPAAWRKIK